MHLRSTVFQGLPHELFGSLLREGTEMFRQMTQGDTLLVVVKKDVGTRPCVHTFFKGQLVDFGTWADSFHTATANERTTSLCALVKLPQGFNPQRVEIPRELEFAIDAYTATLPEHTD